MTVKYHALWDDRDVSILWEKDKGKYIQIEPSDELECCVPLSLSTVRSILRAADELGIVKDEPLVPCPFCGSDAVKMTVGDAGIHYVRCTGCGAEGPGAVSEDAAFAAWNLRISRGAA